MASRLAWLDLEPERLEQGGGGDGRGRPGGAEIHRPAGQLGQAGDIAPGQDVDLLRREPGDQLELVGEAGVLGGLGGQSVGRDKGQIDFGVVEERGEIAGAGIAQHGEHAELPALWEQASHVGREHGFGGGGATGDQAEPGPRGFVPSIVVAGGMDAVGRQQANQNETRKRKHLTQHNTPFPCSATAARKASLTEPCQPGTS